MTPVPATPPLKITGVTANCGNDTVGVTACGSIFALLQAPEGPDVIVLHCQEVHYEKQRLQLMQAIARNANISLAASSLMVTRTTMELEVLAGHTGLATFVLCKQDNVRNAAFDAQEATEVRGENRNKGGYVNSLLVTDNAGLTHRIATISGHLDSYSETIRAHDWSAIKKKCAFEAKTWEALAARVPVLQLAGYDANIRDRFDEPTQASHNLWHQVRLDPRIAPLALAPLGTDVYSAASTFRTNHTVHAKDTKRKGYAKGGSLDFVAVQNNTLAPRHPAGPYRYTEASQNFPLEEGTHRDHHVIVGDTISLGRATPFERVQHYLAAELLYAAPTLAEEIATLTDTTPNRTLLLAIHQHYLSPHGLCIEKIAEKIPKETTNVTPWFEQHTLQTFRNQLDEKNRFQTFCTLFKTTFAHHRNVTGIQHIIKAMEKQQKNGTHDLVALSIDMKKIAASRNKPWSRFHFFCTKPRDPNIQFLYDTLEDMDFPKDNTSLLNDKFQLISDLITECFPRPSIPNRP